ncbi:MAG: alpha-rhamnosidase, partial [Oxalobacteraceae bacterium]
LDNLRGLVMHSDFDPVGQFECSNPMLNRVQQMSLWSYRNNFHSIPTDCPHREKNGWTGDAHLAAEMGLYNFDGAANYEKWLDDIADEQGPKGDYAGIIPTSGWGYNIGPSWDSAYPLIVWYLYQYRGDQRMIEKHYPRLARYVDYVSTRAKDGIVDYGLGDWLPAKTETPAAVTSTAYYYVDSMLVAKMAQMLGKTADAKKYSDQAASIKTAFNTKFYNAQTGQYANGSLTALSCALYQGLVEPQNKAKVVENLVAEVKKQGYHMDVGILGAKYLLTTLADNGHADVAYQMLQQKTLPSYGHWVERGATTLWEDWKGDNSRNHVMFGDVSAWFYKYLAGINAAAPGFKQIVIKPHVLGDLTYARASY